jgi:hypothetical protein
MNCGDLFSGGNFFDNGHFRICGGWSGGSAGDGGHFLDCDSIRFGDLEDASDNARAVGGGKIQTAINAAANALRDPNCASLFGPNVNPIAYLQLLQHGPAGDPMGYLTQGDLGAPSKGLATAAITQGILGSKLVQTGSGKFVKGSTFTGAAITINSNSLAPFSAGFGGYMGYDDATNRAATIIHELGHAIAIMAGSDKSRIREDQDKPKQSAANTKLVLDNCFPKKK